MRNLSGLNDLDAIPLEMNTIPNLKPTWLDNNKQLTPTSSLCNNKSTVQYAT